MLRELNDDRMKKQGYARIAVHNLPPSPEADEANKAVAEFMESSHILIEELKETVRRIKQGDLL